MIDAGQSQPSLDLVRAYIVQAPLLTDPAARQKNIDKTWQTLVSLPFQQSDLVINANENMLQSWLDLLRVHQDNRQDPSLLQAEINDWQTRHPQNPAAKNGLSAQPSAPVQDPNAAASTASSVQVKIYDTSSQLLPAFLAQAQRDGVSMIVGSALKKRRGAIVQR